MNNFQIDNLEFNLGEENYLNFVSTESWYQSVQYFDPYYACFFDGEPSWTYYHGHPVVAYPPSEETNHFPQGYNPIIFANEEIVYLIQMKILDAISIGYSLSQKDIQTTTFGLN